MKKGWIFGLLAGLVLLFFSTGIGINTATEPTCDGQAMTAGMVCKTTNGGVVSEETYEQKLASLNENPGQFDKVGRWVFLGLGAVLTVLSAYKLIAARRKPSADTEQPYPGQPQPHPGYPQHYQPQPQPQPQSQPWPGPPHNCIQAPDSPQQKYQPPQQQPGQYGPPGR